MTARCALWVMECAACGQVWPTDRFNPDCVNPNVCFRCRSKSVGVAYLKYPQGRKEFHGATTRERQEKTIKEFRDNGATGEFAPKWTTTYTGGVGSSFGAT